MLIKCEASEALPGIVSAAGPIDCAPAGFKWSGGEWKYSLGGLAALVIALFGLVLLTDEAMGGGVLVALLTLLGRG